MRRYGFDISKQSEIHVDTGSNDPMYNELAKSVAEKIADECTRKDFKSNTEVFNNGKCKQK